MVSLLVVIAHPDGETVVVVQEGSSGRETVALRGPRGLNGRVAVVVVVVLAVAVIQRSLSESGGPDGIL